MTLRGADAATVRSALSSGDSLPGTGGFAGRVDGTFVRDVLGREPLYVDVESDGDAWAFDPTVLAAPTLLPAGVARDASDGSERAVWTLPEPAPADEATALSTLRDAIWPRVDAVGGREDGRVAVAFSGGVDSAVVATGVPEAPCYVAGFPGAPDVERATAAAEAMGRDLRVVELDHDDVRRAVPAVARATGRTNPMDVAIAVPLFLVAERAAADGFDALALGQGADELFGGYAKVVDPAADHRVAADTVRGATSEVVATLPEQLPRDVLALRAAGVEPVTPLLHDDVVRASLSLPADCLVDGGERKVALRRVAADRVPPGVASADKKAVQYGSYVSRELDRLARQNGFKRRMDDHVGRYVRSLLE
jgi:asparagine synthase (glutamine-hydrolysing)